METGVLGEETDGLLGWTKEEREESKQGQQAKRRAYAEGFHMYHDDQTKKKKLHLPTRAMKVRALVLLYLYVNISHAWFVNYRSSCVNRP